MSSESTCDNHLYVINGQAIAQHGPLEVEKTSNQRKSQQLDQD